jgi:hypothetical protein
MAGNGVTLSSLPTLLRCTTRFGSGTNINKIKNLKDIHHITNNKNSTLFSDSTSVRVPERRVRRMLKRNLQVGVSLGVCGSDVGCGGNMEKNGDYNNLVSDGKFNLKSEKVGVTCEHNVKMLEMKKNGKVKKLKFRDTRRVRRSRSYGMASSVEMGNADPGEKILKFQNHEKTFVTCEKKFVTCETKVKMKKNEKLKKLKFRGTRRVRRRRSYGVASSVDMGDADPGKKILKFQNLGKNFVTCKEKGKAAGSGGNADAAGMPDDAQSHGGGRRRRRLKAAYVTLPRSGGRRVRLRMHSEPLVPIVPVIEPPVVAVAPVVTVPVPEVVSAVQVDDMSGVAPDVEVLPPMLPGVLRKWTKLCARFAVDDGTTPVAELVALLPRAAPCRYAEILQMSIHEMEKIHPEEKDFPSDFDPVQLFVLIGRMNAGHTEVARYVFEQLVVGGGCFPTLYTGPRDEVKVSKNGRKLVFPAAVDPYPAPKVRHAKTQKRRHLDLAMAEVEAKRYLGPFKEADAVSRFIHFLSVSSFLVSRPAAVSTKERLVQNCSDAECNINAMLDDETMWNVELDHTAKMIHAVRDLAALEKQLHMVTLDISKGYRRLFHRFVDRAQLGLSVTVDFDGFVPCFDGKTMSKMAVKKGDVLHVFDKSLPFGLKTSVSSFCAVTTVIRDAVRELLMDKVAGRVKVLCYVDDYVLLGDPSAVRDGIRVLRTFLKKVGLPENELKSQTPGPMGQYLGVDYDLRNPSAVTATLPADKKVRYVKHLKYYIGKAQLSADGTLVLTRKELQSVVGKLAHAAYIFGAGRPFYQRLLQLLRGSPKKGVVLSPGCVDDMIWWVEVLEKHSGSVLLNPAQRVVKVYTDASTTTGYGVICRGEYFWGEWSQEVRDLLASFELTINEAELVALNFAMETFGEKLRGCHVVFRCDNMACVSNIKSMSSKQPVRNTLLRRLYGIAAYYGIDISSTYINTKDNVHADSLSRGDMSTFFSLPQNYPLFQVQSPNLTAMALLTDPMGSADLSTPQRLAENGWK